LLRLLRAARQREIQFLFGDDLRGLRIHQMHALAALQQAFEQAHAVGQAGGAGESEVMVFACEVFTIRSVSLSCKDFCLNYAD
jgi:hypothetical protein